MKLDLPSEVVLWYHEKQKQHQHSSKPAVDGFVNGANSRVIYKWMFESLSKGTPRSDRRMVPIFPKSRHSGVPAEGNGILTEPGLVRRLRFVQSSPGENAL